jgi:hypothetical protein
MQNLLNSLGEYYQQKEPLSEIALDIYHHALSKYTFQQIRYAAMEYVSRGGNAQFFPKACDISKIIDGGSVTHEQILAASRAASTPLGVLGRIYIGTSNLDNRVDDFLLKSITQEFLDRMPEWKEKARSYSYTPHELAVMAKHGVSPSMPLFEGIAPPERQPFDMSNVQNSVEYIKLMAPAVEPLPELSKEQIQSNHERVASVLKDLFG